MDPATGILALTCIALIFALALSYRRRGQLRDEVIILRAQIAKFDRDGNGKIGGSMPQVIQGKTKLHAVHKHGNAA